jgi:hypothetical protein
VGFFLWVFFRENNHSIKVIPEVRLAKRNYYRLALKKIEKLKKKLKVYTDLGMIGRIVK